MPSRSKRRLDSTTEIRQVPLLLWVPYLVSPFLLGFVVKVFPVDHTVAGLALIATLLGLGAFGRVFAHINPGWVALLGGALLVGVLFSLPFWALQSRATTLAGNVHPAYSYRDAKANPDAFAKWWNFFVDEVVRTNAIVFEHDPEGAPYQGTLPFRPKPGVKVDFYRGRIVINNQGYRGDDFPRLKGNVYRILALGDSVTFGQSLFPESLPWPAVLQDILSRDLLCARPIQVVNGGVNGFRLRDGINRLRRDYSWLKPDLVIPYFGWNTMVDLGINPPVVAAPTPPVGGSRPELLRWYVAQAAASLFNESASRWRQTLKDFTGRGLRGNSPIESDYADVVRTSVLYADYLELIDHSRRFGYSLYLMSFNTAVAPDGPDDAKAFYQSVTHAVKPLLAEVQIHNAMLQRMSRERGIPFIDTGAELYGKYDSDLYIDIVHFTPRGEVVLATNIYRGIRPLLLADANLGCRPK